LEGIDEPRVKLPSDEIVKVKRRFALLGARVARIYLSDGGSFLVSLQKAFAKAFTTATS
jgi:hypothetical protein